LISNSHEQEPVPVAAHARKRPRAAELVAEQLELELAALDLRARRLRLQELEAAGVPDDRRTGAVAAFGNDALEIRVLDGMVFDVNRQPLLVRAH
jgi:hypothetical protein